MAGILSLPLALPLTVASLAYLNGRFGLSADARFISAFTKSTVGLVLREKRDRMTLFYDLEDKANNKKYADHPWLVFEGKSWTYKEAYSNVLKYSQWLKEELGVQKNDVVAVDFTNSDTMVFFMFALWNIRARPALINYNLTGKPLLHCIRASNAAVLLLDPQNQAMFTPEVQGELQGPFRSEGGAVSVVLVTKEVEERILSATEGWREPDETRAGLQVDDMAMLIYTSGTTGLPKPAIVSWHKMCLGSSITSNMLPINKNDILYTCMPLYHSSATILGMAVTLQAGATFAVGKRFSSSTFWAEVRQTKATVVQYVGETLRYLLASPASSLDMKHNVRMVYGNGLRPDVWPVFQKRFAVPMVAEFYAATEGPAILFNRSRNDFTRGAVGKVGGLTRSLLGKRAYLVKFDHEANEALRDPITGFCIPAHEDPGELLYKLDENNIKATFQGYYGKDNANATKKKILRNVKVKGDAYFSTGDIMRMDRYGRVYFIDRIGDTFRWRSENVSTAEVSEVLGMTPGIAEANVYGVLVPRHDGRAGCAAIILKDQGAALTTASESVSPIAEPSQAILTALATGAQKNLPKYAVPLFLRFTRALDITGTNKQQKHALREQGIHVKKIRKTGDRIYWLKSGQYVPFKEDDLKQIERGSVRL